VIDTNEFVLVVFYASGCEHCKVLPPEYAKAATQLKEEGSEIKLGKVDEETAQIKLVSNFEIPFASNFESHPKIRLYRNGILVFNRLSVITYLYLHQCLRNTNEIWR
jgi:thiol-disulfide isomerase/thioredoxin